MAPPQTSTAPSNKSVQEKLLELAQSLQFAWFAGHVTLLLCALRYGLSYIFFSWNSRWARFSYRTLFISAAVTYGIVVYKSIKSKAKASKNGKPSMSTGSFIADENTQYLAMALIFLIQPQIGLAVLPYAIYSVFHVATYTRTYLLPILQPQPAGKTSPLSETISRFVRDNYDASMTIVSILEIALWFRVFFGFIFSFRIGAVVLLLCYSVFLRIRHLVSTFMQGAFAQLTARGDGLVGQSNIPPAVRNVWNQLKGIVQLIAKNTDPQHAMAKAQAESANASRKAQ